MDESDKKLAKKFFSLQRLAAESMIQPFGEAETDATMNLHEVLLEDGIPDLPPVKEWLWYYRNQKHLYPVALQVIFTSGECNESVVAGYEDFIRLAFGEGKLFDDNDIERAFGNPPELKDTFYRLLRSLQAQSETDDEASKGKIDTFPPADTKDPRYVFLIRVALPCMLFCGEDFTWLYRRARQGDIDAICTLLKIDKAVIADSRIAAVIHKASMDLGSEAFKKIHRAFSGTVKITSLKNAKLNIAGMIDRFLAVFGINFNAPEIRALFDKAYAQSHEDEMIDPDFSEEPHQFYKKVKRRADKFTVFDHSLKDKTK